MSVNVTEDFQKRIVFCPRCKSKNVQIDITASLALGIPQNWICNDCGFTNVVFPEFQELNTNKNKIEHG